MRTPRVPVKPARRRQPQTGVITVLIHACTTGIMTIKRWCAVVIVHHGCIMIALHRQRSFFRESGPVSDAGSYLSRSWTSRPQLPPLPSLYKTCPKPQLSYRNNTNRRLAFWRRKTRPIRDSSQKINSCDRGLLMCPQPLMRKHGGSFPDPTARRFSGAV